MNNISARNTFKMLGIMVTCLALVPLGIGVTALVSRANGAAIFGTCFVLVGVYFLYSGFLAWRSFSPKAVMNVCAAVGILSLVVILVAIHMILRPVAPGLAQFAGLASLGGIMLTEHRIGRRLASQYFPESRK